MAPRIGPSTAVIATAIVVAHANRAVAIGPGRFAAAYAAKNGGNTAVITVDWKAEFAQSYIAHARSSGRSSPMRVNRLTGQGSRSEGAPRDPLAKQRIDDEIAGAFLEQHVLVCK